MTFPTGVTISTANLSSATGDPSQARGDLLSLVENFNSLVASKNSAEGVVVLDGSGKITVSQMPTTWASTGTITLQPSTKIVSIRDVLRLQPRVTADMSQLTSPSAGDICYLTDGDAGRPCLGIYTGSAWRVVRLMTTVGDVGAAITATFSISAEAT